MTIKPTLKLSPTDQRHIAAAQLKAQAGDRDKITKAEQRAIDKARTIRDQESFAGIAQTCPRELVAELFGVDRKALKEAARKLDLPIDAAEVDLCDVLPQLFSRVFEAIDSATICRTYRELSDALQLTGRDPVRQLKEWHARGMPGKPGSPGRRDGEFVVADCRGWIAANVDRTNEPAGDSDDVREMRRRILQLDLEIKEAERLEQLGRLADVDDVAAFNAQCVHNARSILEAWPDKAIERLPADTADTIRRAAFDDATKLVDDTLEELARIIDGDDDPTDDDDETEATEATQAPTGD